MSLKTYLNLNLILFEFKTREYVGTQGTMVREHVKHVSTSAHKPHWHVSM